MTLADLKPGMEIKFTAYGCQYHAKVHKVMPKDWILKAGFHAEWYWSQDGESQLPYGYFQEPTNIVLV